MSAYKAEAGYEGQRENTEKKQTAEFTCKTGDLTHSETKKNHLENLDNNMYIRFMFCK